MFLTFDYDLFEDTEIEINQAIEMCSAYRDILAGMNFAFIPLSDVRSGFYIPVISSFILSAVGAIFFYRYTNKVK